MQKHCKKCDKELDYLLPFQCKYCNNYFCEEHRLPENHNCKNVKISWDSWKKRQKKLQNIPEERHSSQRIPIQSTPETDYVKPRKDNLIERRYQSYGGRQKFRKLSTLHLSNLTKVFFGALIIFITRLLHFSKSSINFR